MARNKRSKKQIFQLFTQYGIHIWAILIIANAVMLYAYQFASHAANKSDTTLNILNINTPTPSIQIVPSTPSIQPSSAPLGPSIYLAFSVPGIGSGSSVMKPLHFKRTLTVFLFSPDVNSLNHTVKPLYTIQGTATFDSNPYSSTYTSFVSPIFDLGSDVKDGNYQIAFRTNLSLRTLIKQSQTDIGGEIFSLAKGNDTIQIPLQTVLMGDTIPNQGDNSIDVSDYNAFINCYGSKNTSTFCKGKNYGDFNDDGVIDGVDYNILLRSLDVLSQEGVAAPKLSPSPMIPYRVTRLKNPTTPIPTKNKQITTSPTASTVTPPSGGNPIIGFILFLLFIIIIGAIGIVLYFKNEKIHNLINTLIHLSPTGEPSSEETETPETPEEIQEGQEKSTEQAVEDATTTAIPTPAEQIVQTKQSPPPANSSIVEKDCYVKTKGSDETDTGMWLLLTDDNGAINAHYAKKDAKDGFCKVKGIMKTENDKTFLEILELTAE
ncbi:MAG TPA: hypothetical protein VNW29_00580 [Candidatus Sulfotelmatobacter sp.]|nr:hypothetical protein [Candidatus Sulfotelmatobacter sp.]